MRVLADVDVVLASNRGPVSFIETDEGWDLGRGAGGLAGALDPVARKLGEHAVWIAAASSPADRRALAAGATEKLPEMLGYRLELIDFDEDIYSRYYDVSANRMLWFANHCLWDELDIHEFGEAELSAWSEAYEPVNRRFADTVMGHADEHALVLLQDYHLSTAARYLRDERPTQTIGHFTHSSFCCAGLERIPAPIPHRVIEGMLASDLVGFHTLAWAQSFYECCLRVGADVDASEGSVEHRGHRSWVRTYPIPIDAHDLAERAGEEDATRWRDRFLSTPHGKYIVRADRTEPSKNIVRGFEAYGRLLDRRPDLEDTVRFIACLYPSRQSMPEYERYTAAIRRAVDEVNARHPGSIELYLEDDYDRTLGALRVYDVLLVNSIMDGMNLVSKEGPVVNENDGVLVLSRGAGSFEELGGFSIGIDDPFDVDATAAALEQALAIPQHERSAAAIKLRQTVEQRKPQDWIESQLEDLESIRDGGTPKSSAP